VHFLRKADFAHSTSNSQHLRQVLLVVTTLWTAKAWILTAAEEGNHFTLATNLSQLAGQYWRLTVYMEGHNRTTSPNKQFTTQNNYASCTTCYRSGYTESSIKNWTQTQGKLNGLTFLIYIYIYICLTACYSRYSEWPPTMRHSWQLTNKLLYTARSFVRYCAPDDNDRLHDSYNASTSVACTVTLNHLTS